MPCASAEPDVTIRIVGIDQGVQLDEAGRRGVEERPPPHSIIPVGGHVVADDVARIVHSYEIPCPCGMEAT